MATPVKVFPRNIGVDENEKLYDSTSAGRNVAFRGDEESKEKMENVSTRTPQEEEVKSIAPASRDFLNLSNNWLLFAFMVVVLLVSVTAIVLSVLAMIKNNSSDERGSENHPDSDLLARIKALEENITILQVRLNQSIDQLQGLTSIPGIKGSKGERGIQGLQGPQGLNGSRGDKGEQGDPGRNGTDGVDGQQGAVGPQGVQGLNGSKGEQGPQGLQGEPGRNGTDGVDGQKGDAGPEGPQGAGNFTQCSYKVVQGAMTTPGASASTDATLTEPEGKKILGATCSTNRAAEYQLSIVLATSGANIGKYIYTCKCRGDSSLFTSGGSMQCFLHYWECPLTT